MNARTRIVFTILMTTLALPAQAIVWREEAPVVSNVAQNCAQIASSTVDSAEDAAISTYIYARLAADSHFANMNNLNVSTTEGIVTFTGVVNNIKEPYLLARLAAMVKGVKKIDISQLIVGKQGKLVYIQGERPQPQKRLQAPIQEENFAPQESSPTSADDTYAMQEEQPQDPVQDPVQDDTLALQEQAPQPSTENYEYTPPKIKRVHTNARTEAIRREVIKKHKLAMHRRKIQPSSEDPILTNHKNTASITKKRYTAEITLNYKPHNRIQASARKIKSTRVVAYFPPVHEKKRVTAPKKESSSATNMTEDYLKSALQSNQIED